MLPSDGKVCARYSPTHFWLEPVARALSYTRENFAHLGAHARKPEGQGVGIIAILQNIQTGGFLVLLTHYHRLAAGLLCSPIPFVLGACIAPSQPMESTSCETPHSR